ncbi:hypothetical protein J2754_001495 [Halarchaeum solikamskense]|uniref:hypothetical protein n=1 Tax=Halarchaeum nitratireducens TaxID=489913 RepID=UPI001B3AD91D|nr:hypothetical protein [Halarchaeum solikamskense]MBP2251174.1 hypothetical protein [Halarchaeum solikamskense]
MSDAGTPRSGHPDDRHGLGELRGATVREGRVLELHGASGSVAVRVPVGMVGALLDVVRDLDEDPLGPELQACPVCGMVGLPERIEEHDCPVEGER